LAKIESRGSGGYAAVGKSTAYGKAYGKYQVLKPNISAWSREALGYAVTPKQWLESPEIQDLAAQLRVTKLLRHYKLKEVPLIWFTGNHAPKMAAQDANGTTAWQYQRRNR